MTTIKSHTDIKQANKLAEFLPLESADMTHIYGENTIVTPYLEAKESLLVSFVEKKDSLLPCWSLAALLSVLPMIDFTTPQLVGTPKTLYRCMYNDNLKSPACDNAVDACYEMIIHLRELNLI